MRALIWAQHLLGIGHLRRAERLAKALHARGHTVTLVQGGPPVGPGPSGVTCVQLPPIKSSDRAFTSLVDAQGEPVEKTHWARRADLLKATAARLQPDLVILEMYPFGRRAFAVELEPFLDDVASKRPRPLVVTSLRDILIQKPDPSRYRRMAEHCRNRLDAVLVHSDPRLVSLDLTFPETDRIRDLIRYTGYISEQAPANVRAAAGEGVVVSAGGGAVGARVLEAAVAAAAASGPALGTWTLIGGALGAEGTADGLPPHVKCLGHVDDLPERLARCRVAVSQAGYNTVVESLSAHRPMVLVPFADGQETEQTTRAERIAALGWAKVIKETELAPEALVAAVNTMAGATPAPLDLAIDGAERSALLLEQLAERPRP